VCNSLDFGSEGIVILLYLLYWVYKRRIRGEERPEARVQQYDYATFCCFGVGVVKWEFAELSRPRKRGFAYMRCAVTDLLKHKGVDCLSLGDTDTWNG
jgi:hypothetical protein